MHTGDGNVRSKCCDKPDRLVTFAKRFINEDGVLASPPPLSMHWFSMGGPVFGPSVGLNVAY